MQYKDIDDNKEKKQLTVKESKEKINALLEGVVTDPEVRSHIVTQVMQIESSFYSGPIPPPKQLEEYAKIEGALLTILKMAEKEQSFRHKVTNKELNFPYFGLICGFLSFLGCLICSFFLAYFNHTYLAGALFSVTSLGVISIMIKGRISVDSNPNKIENNSKNTQRKNKNNRNRN